MCVFLSRASPPSLPIPIPITSTTHKPHGYCLPPAPIFINGLEAYFPFSQWEIEIPFSFLKERDRLLAGPATHLSPPCCFLCGSSWEPDDGTAGLFLMDGQCFFLVGLGGREGEGEVFFGLWVYGLVGWDGIKGCGFYNVLGAMRCPKFWGRVRRLIAAG